MNIDQFRAKNFRMKMFVVIFLNRSYGKMAVFVRTANARDLITFLVQVLGPVFTSVFDANGNLR